MNLSPAQLFRPVSSYSSNPAAIKQSVPVHFGSDKLLIPSFDPLPGFRRALETVPQKYTFRQDSVKQLLESMIDAGEKADKNASIPPVRALFIGPASAVEEIAKAADRPLLHLDMSQDVYDWDMPKTVEQYDGKNGPKTLYNFFESLHFANLESSIKGTARPIVLLSNIEGAGGNNHKTMQVFKKILSEGKLHIASADPQGIDLDFKGIDFVVATRWDSKLGFSRLVGTSFTDKFNAEGTSNVPIRAALTKVFDKKLEGLRNLFKIPVNLPLELKEELITDILEDYQRSEEAAIETVVNNHLLPVLSWITGALFKLDPEAKQPTSVDITYDPQYYPRLSSIRFKLNFPEAATGQ